MAQPQVSAIRCIEFDVPDLEASLGYYEHAWGLSLAARDGGSCYLRATGPEHHALVLHEAPALGLAAIGFTAPDKAAVDGIHARAQGLDAKIVSQPASLGSPGGGYGFSLLHPEGWKFTVSSDVSSHGDTDDADDRPRRFSHVALGSEQTEEACAFMVDALGFTLSDRTEIINFLRCDADHHSIAFAHVGPAYVHHVAYEMPSLDALRLGAARMEAMGYPLDWGIGRHGPGGNIYSHFVEPHGFMNEYTAEMEQLDATYPTGTPEQWEGRLDRSDEDPDLNPNPPSEALQEAHQSHPLLPAA